MTDLDQLEQLLANVRTPMFDSIDLERARKLHRALLLAQYTLDASMVGQAGADWNHKPSEQP